MKRLRKWRKGNRKKKLQHEYILIVLLLSVLLLFSFSIINFLAKKSTLEQSKQASAVIFQQAHGQIVQFEEDVKNLRISITGNPSVKQFTSVSDFTSRWAALEYVRQTIGGFKRTNTNLENVGFYDGFGKLFFSLGEVRFPQNELVPARAVNYSGAIFDYAVGKPYVEVTMPLYIEDEKDSRQNMNTVSLLFNTKSLQKIVDNSLINQHSAIALLDGENNVIVQSGQWRAGADDITQIKTEDGIVYSEEIGETGWRLVNAIPKSSLLVGLEPIRKIINITFVAFALVMAGLNLLIYRRVIRPITKQTAFLSDYANDTRRRIAIVGNNEVSEMARMMNKMFDDIEVLNEEIIAVRKRYLEMEFAKKQTEMIAYRSQINPHFLYNTFECIQGMALHHEVKDIAEITKSLARLFRYNISGDELVPIRDELLSLGEYARIMEYRFLGKHTLTLQAEDHVLHYKIPKMILQPLVENAFIHGIEARSRGGCVLVSIGREGSNLVLRIADDGGGISQNKQAELLTAMQEYDFSEILPDKKQGIGFLNVYRRFRLFYGSTAVFQIESQQEEGTRITLSIPLELLHQHPEEGEGNSV